MRLIDADALVDDGLRFQDGYDYDGIMMVRLGDVTKSIRNAPTVSDVAPIRSGKWEYDIRLSQDGKRWMHGFACTNCGEFLRKEFNYCPKCGAKMNGGTDK